MGHANKPRGKEAEMGWFVTGFWIVTMGSAYVYIAPLLERL